MFTGIKGHWGNMKTSRHSSRKKSGSFGNGPGAFDREAIMFLEVILSMQMAPIYQLSSVLISSQTCNFYNKIKRNKLLDEGLKFFCSLYHYVYLKIQAFYFWFRWYTSTSHIRKANQNQKYLHLFLLPQITSN